MIRIHSGDLRRLRPRSRPRKKGGGTVGSPTKEGVVGETMGFPTSEGKPWVSLHHQYPDKNEQQNVRKQHQKPRQFGGSGTTYDIQHPCPKDDIHDLQEENRHNATSLTRIHANAIQLRIGHVLQSHDDDGNHRNH